MPHGVALAGQVAQAESWIEIDDFGAGLLLTGCRKGEIANLRWDYVDVEHECLRLPDSKCHVSARNRRPRHR